MAAGGDPRRDFLLSVFRAGLDAVDGRRRMRAALAGRTDLEGAWLIAAGKAAAAMTLGALDALGRCVERALVVCREADIVPELAGDARVACRPGGHPLPDATSLAAGEAALAMAGQAGPGRPLLLLVSGGASSLLEALPPAISLDDLRRFTGWALASGRDIAVVNAVRRRLSRVKDGRLLAALSTRRVEGYYLSDVPGDDPALVGSGLIAGAGEAGVLPDGLPDWVLDLVRRGTPAVEVPSIPMHRVGCLDEALGAVVAAAQGVLPVARPAGRMDGDAVSVARRVCANLRRGHAGLWVFGGETTVVLPDGPGRGGRCQHLALAAAREIADRDDLLLLAAGTDGADGNTADAGALVDGGTVRRGEDAGLDAGQCLRAADSGRFLEASGDLVHTGSTGTNVGDLVLALRWDPGHSPGRRASM